MYVLLDTNINFTQALHPVLHHAEKLIYKICISLLPTAARHYRGQSGGDGRRTHPAPAGGGHSDPAGGGRDAHRLRQQRAAAYHAARPGAALPAETLTWILSAPPDRSFFNSISASLDGGWLQRWWWSERIWWTVVKWTLSTSVILTPVLLSSLVIFCIIVFCIKRFFRHVTLTSTASSVRKLM